MKPPFDYEGPRYVRRAKTREGRLTWELVWGSEALLEYIRAGKGALAVFGREEIFAICPEPDRGYKQMVGAMVAAVASYHGFKPEGTQDLRESIWKRVACFVPAGASIKVKSPDQSGSSAVPIDISEQLDDLRLVQRRMEIHLLKIARHMGLDLS